AAPRVQTDHQARGAKARRVGVDIVWQVAGATFLRAFDQDDDAPMWLAVVFERLHGGQGREHSVAVVRPPTAIEATIGIEVWRPRTQAVTPSYHGWLLVQVTIHQHRVGYAARK